MSGLRLKLGQPLENPDLHCCFALRWPYRAIGHRLPYEPHDLRNL